MPTHCDTATLGTLTLGGAPASYTVETIKGIDYAVFLAQPGTYQATYSTATPDVARRPSEPPRR